MCWHLACAVYTKTEFAKPQEDAQVQVMADRLVDYAQMCMVNKKRVSPFERAAAREGLFYRGGVCGSLQSSLVVILIHFTASRRWTT